jgi:hypothetical protein
MSESSTSRYRTLLAGLGALLLLGVPVAAAQDVSSRPAGTMSRKAPYAVVYDPIAGTIELENEGGKVVGRWEQYSSAAPLADIPADRPVNIIVRNANPLLYDYTVEAEVVRQEEIKSCTNVGGRFLGEAFLLSSAAVTGTVSPPFTQPALPPGFLNVNQMFSSVLSTRGAARLSTNQLETEMNRIRAEVTGFATFTTRVNSLARTVEDSIALFAATGESVPLETVIERFRGSLEAIAPGLSDPAQTPLVIERHAAEVAPAIATLNGLVGAINAGNYAGSRNDLAAQEAILLQRQVNTGVAQMETSYPALQRSLLRIARVRAQSRRIFTIAESQGTVRRLVITSTTNDQYAEVLRLHEGETEVFTRPRQSVLCELSLGLSWIDPLPAYGIDDDGNLTDTNTEDRRVAPVLMLHIAAPAIPSLGLGLGLGIGKNNAPDLYLGASLLTFSPIALNVGYIWQRTPQLPSGLRLGEVPAEFDPRLFTDPDLKFEGTLYFGIGILR